MIKKHYSILLLLICNITTITYGWNHYSATTGNRTADIGYYDDNTSSHTHQISHGHGTNHDNSFDDPYNGSSEIPAHIAVLASFLLAMGTFLMLGGFRVFMATMGIIGFIAGGTIAWICLIAGENSLAGNVYDHQSLVYSFTCYGAGLLVAGIAVYLWNITLYLGLGLIVGYIMAMFLWSWSDNLIFQDSMAARHLISIIPGAFAIIGLIFMEYFFACFLSSFLGAYLFMLGLDSIIHKGLVNGPRAMLDPVHHIHYTVTTEVRLMLGGVIGLCVVATLIQLVMNRGRRFGLNLVVNEVSKANAEEKD